MLYSAKNKGFFDGLYYPNHDLSDAVEITDAYHAELLAAHRIEADADGNPIAVAPPLPTFTERKAAKLHELNSSFEAENAAIKAGYPDSEVLSWPKQEQEARACAANANAATPLLDALATARGISKAELVSRVIAKADLFTQFSGAIIGKRQALEDALTALPADATAADFDAIQW